MGAAALCQLLYNCSSHRPTKKKEPHSHSAARTHFHFRGPPSAATTAHSLPKQQGRRPISVNFRTQSAYCGDLRPGGALKYNLSVSRGGSCSAFRRRHAVPRQRERLQNTNTLRAMPPRVQWRRLQSSNKQSSGLAENARTKVSCLGRRHQ